MRKLAAKNSTKPNQCHQEISMQNKQQRLSFHLRVKEMCNDRQLVLNKLIISYKVTFTSRQVK